MGRDRTQNITPPRLAAAILTHLIREDLTEEVLGDLEENFLEQAGNGSLLRARFNYWYQVFNYCRPFALGRSRSPNSNQIAMFRNYSKIAWRNLIRNKMYSAIKIGGFAVSITLCLLIALFVQDELSYDKSLNDGGPIYRVLYATDDPSDDWRMGTSFPAQTASVLRDHFPEVKKAGRLIAFDGWFDAGSNLFRPADQGRNVLEERFAYADPELLEMLQIPMVYGTREHALAELNSILISKRKADKYFPNQDPVGKTVILNDDESKPFVIGGVMENLRNTHIEDFDFFITLSGVEFWPGEQTNWCCWNYSAYIQVRPGTDPGVLEEKLLLIRDDYIIAYKEKNGDQRAENARQYHSLKLQPVGDIYLKSQDIADTGLIVSDIRIVWLFSAIGGFILLLACVNFINLSTAKSANRAREVGLRKVVGSYRINLIHQFLTESIIFSSTAVLLGAALAWMAMPYFNMVAEKELVFPLSEWWFLPLLAGLAFIIGALSGLYPSLYLSSFKPITVLRGGVSRGSKNSMLRSVLVVFQFTTSIVLIVGAFMVYKQMQFILNKKLGFDKEQVVMIEGTNTLGEQLPTFKEEILRLAEVENASASSFLPVQGTRRDGRSWWKDGRNKIDNGIGGQFWRVDPDYLQTMGMKLVEGRMFSFDFASDSAAIVINQTMARELGLENPVGERIMNSQTWVVVGVVEDFHFETLKGKIRPLAMVRDRYGSILSVRTNGQDMAATLARITRIWDEFKANQPFRFTFLDDSYARMYEDVQRTGNLFSAFAIFGIMVACLGLFGLSAFLVEQRSKEISIRKVLGASIRIILQLLTLNFLRLVVISLVIAVPIGWYMMNSWLDDFEYRIPMTWDVFGLAGILVVIIAMVTVSFESVRAALVNPVDGLRAE